jgi:alkanesulfonate monooxygenase SsuD/methylene tetrahydromethanopterin reductase-like flavin-dependent oxidoreductase (luciferase family)
VQIGIGLPNMIAGTPTATILEWARKADAGPFSTLSTLDRLVYPNYEALMTLAAVTSVTQRIRLMTTVLIAPLRNPGVLAKQSASLDALSGGRLTLGLGIGGREDDFMVANEPFHLRGQHFEEQLNLMRRAWAGESPIPGVSPMGPSSIRAGGPEVLIGGYSTVAVRRAAQWDGYIAGVRGGAESAAQLYRVVQQAWQEAGRLDKPRLVCAAYFGLGPDGLARGGAYLKDYYAYMGPQADQIAQSLISTPDDLKRTKDQFLAIGADELILWPCLPDLDQLDRVVDSLG